MHLRAGASGLKYLLIAELARHENIFDALQGQFLRSRMVVVMVVVMVMVMVMVMVIVIVMVMVMVMLMVMVMVMVMVVMTRDAAGNLLVQLVKAAHASLSHKHSLAVGHKRKYDIRT